MKPDEYSVDKFIGLKVVDVVRQQDGISEDYDRFYEGLISGTIFPNDEAANTIFSMDFLFNVPNMVDVLVSQFGFLVSSDTLMSELIAKMNDIGIAALPSRKTMALFGITPYTDNFEGKVIDFDNLKVKNGRPN